MIPSRSAAIELLRCAVAHHEAERLEQAETFYRQALTVDPSLAEGHRRLAELARRAGQYEVALAHFETAAALEPAVAEFHLERGTILSGFGRYVEAAHCF